MTCLHLPLASVDPWQGLHMSPAVPHRVLPGSWERRCVLLAVVTGVDLLLATTEDLTSTSLAAKYILLLLIFCLLPHEWMGKTRVYSNASVILGHGS